MSNENKDDTYINNDDFDFGFVEAYDDTPAQGDERLLPENTAPSAINCAFVGVGGGGGKLAKAFLDVGFNKTLLVNTTVKDQPSAVDPQHFLLVPGADGVGKDVNLGKKVLGQNSALYEDALRPLTTRCKLSRENEQVLTKFMRSKEVDYATKVPEATETQLKVVRDLKKLSDIYFQKSP